MAGVSLGSLVSCRAREKESTALLWLPGARGEEELGLAGGKWQGRRGMRSEDVEGGTDVCLCDQGRAVMRTRQSVPLV